MMHRPSKILAGALLFTASTFVPVAQAKTCLMIYQMADNDLEYYLKQDYEELTKSEVIGSEDLRTWIYYDALNKGGSTLPNTVDANGNVLTGTFTGSRYLTYDPRIGKMRVDLEFPAEVNSDQPATITAFMEHAMLDCLSNGYDSLMAVFSSHGGGFAGFGGDENVRRKLLQTNANVASGVRSALDNTAGAPNKLDVLGFDACLMQSVGSADDYKDIAKYILASEAVEPGHGWAYEALTSAPTALDLSKEILSTFLSETQGGRGHQSPKTMSIVDTDKFIVFVTALEDLSSELLTTLESGDVSLQAFVSRARSSAVAFESVVDTAGSQNPSGLDIGSFLENLDTLCSPGGALGIALQATTDAYNAMFVDRGVGVGTSAGTGMHIMWPNQGEYNANTNLWNQVLFSNKNYVTEITPNYQALLEWFLSGATPARVKAESESICGLGAEPMVEEGSEGVDPDALIISDAGDLDEDTGFFDVEAEISADVSQMLVEYGIDLTAPLKEMLLEKGYRPTDEDYLTLLGGDVVGTYVGSKFSASWDQNFYFLNITGTESFEALYVFDQGDGSRKIPAMYFPESKRKQVSELQFLDFLFFDFNFWTEQGASFSFLKFSVDEAEGRINNNLALFVSSTGGVFSELPPNQGGLLVPLIYVDAFVQGRQINTLPGGFNQTVIEWNANLDYNLLTTPASQIFKVIPNTDAVVLNMYAYNHADPSLEPESRHYDVIRPDKGGSVVGLVDGQEDSDAPFASWASGSSKPTILKSVTGLVFALVCIVL